jgi:hypothetical protein
MAMERLPMRRIRESLRLRSWWRKTRATKAVATSTSTLDRQLASVRMRFAGRTAVPGGAGTEVR